MSDNLKPFLMVINDETGDFVDIEMIQGVVLNEGSTTILLQSTLSVTSPLKPREIWSRINVIRHKYGQQQRRTDPFGPSTPLEKPYPTIQVGKSDTVSPDKK